MKPTRNGSGRISWLLIMLTASATAASLVRAQQGGPPSVLDALAQAQIVMYVGAHADDENSINGLLARAAGAGKKVYMVCFTRGENEPMDVGVPKGRKMAAARMEWLRDSAAILGAEPVQLPYVDGPSSVEELEQGVIRYWHRETTPSDVIAHWRANADRDPFEDMIRLIREKRPDLILTWEKTQGWTGNAEHRTVGTLAERAFFDAANPEVFPQQLGGRVRPWQPRWLYWVVRGDGDGSGPHAVETVSCEAPGPNGQTACEAKGAGLAAYRRHTMRTATAEQLQQMQAAAVAHARQRPEHVQLAHASPIAIERTPK